MRSGRSCSSEGEGGGQPGSPSSKRGSDGQLEGAGACRGRGRGSAGPRRAPAGLGQQRLAGHRQGDLAGVALEQRLAQLVLELADAVAEGGRATGPRPGRRRRKLRATAAASKQRSESRSGRRTAVSRGSRRAGTSPLSGTTPRRSARPRGRPRPRCRRWPFTSALPRATWTQALRPSQVVRHRLAGPTRAANMRASCWIRTEPSAPSGEATRRSGRASRRRRSASARSRRGGPGRAAGSRSAESARARWARRCTRCGCTPGPALIRWTSPGRITEPVPMLSLCSSAPSST
jgi:hypothetical protein